jgi:hypothetical protein
VFVLHGKDFLDRRPREILFHASCHRGMTSLYTGNTFGYTVQPVFQAIPGTMTKEIS